MSDRIIHVTDASFEQDVIKAADPVLVDYWADWCGPCKMIAPVLDEIAAEYQGRLRVAKLNIDQNPDTPPRYGIRGIPTLMLFKQGEVEATKVGAVSKSQLTAFIDSHLCPPGIIRQWNDPRGAPGRVPPPPTHPLPPFRRSGTSDASGRF